MTGDTSARGYWVNWRVLICSMLVLSSTALALLLIFRFEGKGKDGNAPEEEEEEEEEEGVLYEDETWKPCLTTIHPAWLLAFRIAAFLLLFALLLITASVDGPSIFYYYTQWTFTLVTIYFGLGSLLSVYGCYKHHKVDNFELDSELGTDNYKNPSPANGQQPVRKRAGFLCYAFQIIYQINAGAVVLTDCVFWFIIVPFLTIRDYNLNFLIVNMHTINAVFLLGETALNSLRFPWFRIGYFFMWTVVYVVFQWILHACVKLWWPYPFLDLASSYSPLWYLSVALMHIPCYGIFALIIKLKHHIYSTRYPNTYQCKKFPSELSRRKIREEQTKERE